MPKESRTKGKDGFSIVGERVCCRKKGGCSGSIGLADLQRRSKKGLPSECRVCGKCYPNPPKRPPKEGSDIDKDAQIRSLKAQLAAEQHKSKKFQSTADNTTTGSSSMEVDDAKDKQDTEKTKQVSELIEMLQVQINSIKGLDEKARAIFDAQGGYDKVLQELQAKLDQARADKRDLKPLATQRTQADNWLKKNQKIHFEANAKLQSLEDQKQELEAKITAQKQVVEDAKKIVAAAHAHLAEITSKLSEGMPGDTQGVAGTAVLDDTQAKFVQMLLESISQDTIRATVERSGVNLDVGQKIVQGLASRLGTQGTAPAQGGTSSAAQQSPAWGEMFGEAKKFFQEIDSFENDKDKLQKFEQIVKDRFRPY